MNDYPDMPFSETQCPYCGWKSCNSDIEEIRDHGVRVPPWNLVETAKAKDSAVILTAVIQDTLGLWCLNVLYAKRYLNMTIQMFSQIS